MLGAYEVLKISDLLVLELQMFVSHNVVLASKLRTSAGTTSAPSIESSLQKGLNCYSQVPKYHSCHPRLLYLSKA